jgi:cytosine deaminase
MLEVLFLSSHILWMTTKSDMEKLYDMITIDAARAIGIKNFKLEVGSDANLVVLNEENMREVIRNHGEPLFIISHGKLVDKSKFLN